jgi:squalene monooxygenase
MTVALNDVVMLRDLLGGLPEGGLRDWENVRAVLAKWHWKRKPLASTINILSVALYDLFGADGGFSFWFSFWFGDFRERCN